MKDTSDKAGQKANSSARRPLASPEYAKHLLSDLKAMHAAGQIKLASGNTIQPDHQPPKARDLTKD